jgi:hypothetical protein
VAVVESDGENMTAETIESVIRVEPRRPFRILMDDGEEVFVLQPRKANVSGPTVSCVGISRRGEVTEPAARLRILPVDRVVKVEHLLPN